MSSYIPGKKPWERPKKKERDQAFENSAMNLQATDQPSNFVQSTITLEDIDKAVYREFNSRFKIMGQEQKLFIGDADTSSLPMMNFESFDQDKGFLRWPFLIYTRTDSKKQFRTNPAYKMVNFAIPIKKAQGIVFEEYITEGPVNWVLTYEFTFVTYFREAINQLEEQVNFYFRNKGNIIVHDSQRYSIRPENQDQICDLNMVNRNTASDATMYIMKFKCKVYCWTRNMETVQKRERPNSYTIDFIIKDENDKVLNQSKDVINIERYIVEDKPDPNDEIGSRN